MWETKTVRDNCPGAYSWQVAGLIHSGSQASNCVSLTTTLDWLSQATCDVTPLTSPHFNLKIWITSSPNPFPLGCWVSHSGFGHLAISFNLMAETLTVINIFNTMGFFCIYRAQNQTLPPPLVNCWIFLTRPSCFSKENKLEEGGVFLPSFIIELGCFRRPVSISAGAVTSLTLQKSVAPPDAEFSSQGKCRQKHCYPMIFLKILFIS